MRAQRLRALQYAPQAPRCPRPIANCNSVAQRATRTAAQRKADIILLKLQFSLQIVFASLSLFLCASRVRWRVWRESERRASERRENSVRSVRLVRSCPEYCSAGAGGSATPDEMLCVVPDKSILEMRCAL